MKLMEYFMVGPAMLGIDVLGVLGIDVLGVLGDLLLSHLIGTRPSEVGVLGVVVFVVASMSYVQVRRTQKLVERIDALETRMSSTLPERPTHVAKV